MSFAVGNFITESNFNGQVISGCMHGKCIFFKLAYLPISISNRDGDGRL